MAGERTVKVEILGDSKSAAAAFGSADKAAGGFSDKLAKFAVVGAIGFTAAEKLGGALFNMAQQAADDEASTRRLQTAVENAGGAWDGHTGKINDAIAAGQKLAFTDDDTRDSLTLLMEQTGSQDEALRRLTVAQDLARGGNIDLATASKLVGKITPENTEVLKRLGIVLGENATSEETLQAIEKKFGNQAADYAQTTAGKMAILRDRFGELQETIGYKVLPILTALVGLVLDKLLPAAEKLTDWLSGPLTRAFHAVVTYINGPVIAAFKNIVEYFQLAHQFGFQIDSMLRDLPGPIRGVVSAVGDLITAFGRDGLTGVLEALPDLFRNLGGKLLDAIVAGFNVVTDFGARVGLWIAEKVGSVDWVSLLGTVGGAILDGIVAGFDLAVDFGGTVATWIADKIGSVDWGGAASGAGAAIIDGIVAGWNAVTDFGGRFVDWLVTAISGIDYKDTGKAVLDGIIAGFNATVGWGEQFVTWLWGVVSTPDYGEIASTILSKIATGFYAVKGWGESFVAWVATTVSGVDWTAVGAAILSKITTAYQAVKDWGTAFVLWVEGEIGNADWSGIGQMFVDKLNLAIAAAHVDEQSNAILQALQPLIDRMTSDWITSVQNFKNGINDLVDAFNLLGIAVSVDGNTQSDLKTFGEVVGVVLVGPTVAFTELLLGLSEAFRITAEQTKVTVEIMTTVVSTAWDLVTGIPGIISTGISAVSTTMSTTWDSISTKTSDAWGAIKDFAVNGMTSLKDGVLGLLRGSADTLQGVWDTTWDEIQGKVSAVAGAMYDIGYSIVSGVADGINAGIGLVTDAVNKIIDAIPGPLRHFFGISSPSQYMHDEIGMPIAQGIAVGMTDGADQYIRPAVDYITAMVGTGMANAARIAADVTAMIGSSLTPAPGGGVTGSPDALTGIQFGSGGNAPGAGGGAPPAKPNPLSNTGNLGGAGQLGGGGGVSRVLMAPPATGPTYPATTEPGAYQKWLDFYNESGDVHNDWLTHMSQADRNAAIQYAATHPSTGMVTALAESARQVGDAYSQVGAGYSGGYQSGLAGHDSGDVAYSKVTSKVLLKSGLYAYGGVPSSGSSGGRMSLDQLSKLYDPGYAAWRLNAESEHPEWFDYLYSTGQANHSNAGGGGIGDVFLDGAKVGWHVGRGQMAGKFHRKKLGPAPC